jgi:hypothetical protein
LLFCYTNILYSNSQIPFLIKKKKKEMALEYSSLLIIFAIAAFHGERISAVPQVYGCKFLNFFYLLFF